LQETLHLYDLLAITCHDASMYQIYEVHNHFQYIGSQNFKGGHVHVTQATPLPLPLSPF